MAKERKSVPPPSVLRLAIADLFHEGILTLCIVLALASVIAPLLILLGLKEGVVETLRSRLVEDPTNRELRPQITQEYTQGWFEEIGALPQTGFLVPTIYFGLTGVSVRASDGSIVNLDVTPTANGDPVILENGGVVPEGSQIVLTTDAADELGVVAGDTLQVEILRRGGAEQVTALMLVTSVLEQRAGGGLRLYAPTQFVLDVEAYKRGESVPSRNWPGGDALALPAFDGFFIFVPEPLDNLTLLRLGGGTGVNEIEQATAADFAEVFGVLPSDDGTMYNARAINATVGYSIRRRLESRLRGQNAIVIPYVAPRQATLEGSGPIELCGLSLTSNEAERLGVPLPVWGGLLDEVNLSRLTSVMTPTNAAPPETLQGVDDTTSLGLFLRVLGEAQGSCWLVPVELLGVLRAAEDQSVTFVSDRGYFLDQIAYRGFRLYARSIDDVQYLVDRFNEAGIPTFSQLAQIARVKELDRGLSRVFALLAAVAAIGAAATLFASLYAAVERKRKDLGILRLIGMPKSSLFWIPIYQAIFIGLAALAIAAIGYFTVAWLINTVLATLFGLGNELSRLPIEFLVLAFAGVVIVSGICALFAARQVTKIDPAEAIRDE